MRGIFEQSPACLRSCRITGVQQICDFIDDLHVRSVWPFVRVFVEILDCFDGRANLDVQMTFVLLQKPWIVRRDPTIIADAIVAHDLLA